MKSLHLLMSALLLTSLHADIEYGNRTHYSIRQSDTGLGREQSIWHQHTTNDINNPHGVSVQVTPFISVATRRRAIGSQFGRFNTPDVAIASDRETRKAESSFPYHSIVHAPSAVADDEEAATITLDPSLTITGATISSFHDGARLAPGLSLQLSLPIIHVRTKMEMVGGDSTMHSYFEGLFSQSSPLQEALLYGKITSTHRTVVGPMTALIGYNVLETERSFAGVQFGLSLATPGDKKQETLFSPQSAHHDHHKLIIGLDAGSQLWRSDAGTQLELLCSARLFHLFAGSEYRLVGAYDDDGSQLCFSPYRLAATKGEKGVFPLANKLHRCVSVGSRNQLETNVMLALSSNGWTMNIGYGIFARQADQVTMPTFEENTYAIAHSTYPTSASFTIAGATGMVHAFGRRYLTTSMIDTTTAQSPAQISVTFMSSIGYASQESATPYTLGTGIGYEHGLVHAAPSMLTLWVKGSLSF